MESSIKPRRRRISECARCGAADFRVEYRSDIVSFRGLTLEVDGLSETICNSCGLAWTTDGQQADNLAILKAAFVEKRDEVRKNDGLLTAEEIVRVLNSLAVSKSEASVLFGGGPNAFHKYINGDVLQSFPMDRLLRLATYFGHEAVQFLRSVHGTSLAAKSWRLPVAETLTQATPVVTLEWPADDAPANMTRYIAGSTAGASITAQESIK